MPPISEEDGPPPHLVKGYQSGVYHDVEIPYCDVTHPEEDFTVAEEEASSYRVPKR